MYTLEPNTKPLHSEARLVKRLQSSRKKDRAFSELLDLYQERIYWHIRKMVLTHENANDVLQNTFIRVYRNIEKFEGKSSLLTWIFRIAYNESLRFLEKEKKRSFQSLEDVSAYQIEALKQSEYFDGDELHAKLLKIIEELTEKQRRVFQMKYFDDLSFREISEVLEVSENTLKSSYYAAVKVIEEKILIETN
ncbi:RNA polymerase sigma factor [Pseudotenacibaculum haliotis]|uniref:RNA polymerase sigma factor n=1 Tax=Pseudotenacibaculum haliotis TaxID=1862138 RepID=A0ABW5LS81_9FLAO